jgi:NAD-dependent DNA ligase
MLTFPPSFSAKDKIELLQRFTLVNSYLYYHLGMTIISDHRFDEECRQLYSLMQEYPKEYAESRYYYAMDDFVPYTSFGHVERLNKKDFDSISLHALYSYRFNIERG